MSFSMTHKKRKGILDKHSYERKQILTTLKHNYVGDCQDILKRANYSEDLLMHIFFNLKEAFVELQKDSFALDAQNGDLAFF